MDIEILKTNYAVSYGSVTLKSLQNDNVPELDLLVREAIQNSSDASLKEPGKMYTVSFKTGTFEPKKLNRNLDLVKKILNKRYPDDTADFLEIRDTKTCGLNGCIKKSDVKKDDHGNFFKLIFDTGKRQTQSGAGGNWGFGKSVYYRVGIGIVIFYSRIKEKDAYEDRLIITLIEDEDRHDANGKDVTILNAVEPNSAGKAWWGVRDHDDLLPLQNSDQINDILSIFGIKPFKSKETGTSIIIPYINTQALLDGIIPLDADMPSDVKDHFMNTWASSIPDYLKLAIQKWYAPKIQNRELDKFGDKKWLAVYVNDVAIRKQDMLPFFNLAQEMYLTALAKSCSKEYQSKEYPGIAAMPVNVRTYFEKGTIAGHVAMIQINEEELNNGQGYLNPYNYIGQFGMDGGPHDPIMMYARDPGMIIEYATAGPWVKSLQIPGNADDFIFAFFVPDTEKKIKEDYGVAEYAGMKLGEYLRRCEASDHMGWNDPVKMQIVQRIQKNSVNQMNKQIKQKNVVNIDATASKLSNRLGRNLLPRVGYGKSKGGGSGSGSGGGSGAKIKNAVFTILSQKILGNEIEIDYVLQLTHGRKEVAVSTLIASEGGTIDEKAWDEEIGTKYPIEIAECYVDNVKTTVADPYEIKESCGMTKQTLNRDELNVSLLSETGDSYTKVKFLTHVINPEISGKLRLKAYDKKYRFRFKVE